MSKDTRIAVDVAKAVFEIAISDRPGHVSRRERPKRHQFLPYLAQQAPATAVMEACGSAHYWAREIQKLGHQVILLPPHHVRPYIRRNKTDRTDAKGILEASRNDDIRPVLAVPSDVERPEVVAASAQRDLVVIIPIVLVVILFILMLLLRSVVAPVLLVLSVVLSYGAAMSVSAWVFNGFFGFSGADATVPLFGFVFLVALGVDYNIFLMSRVREESLKHGTRPGILRGLGVTGGVITSAGVVLAATFAALGVIPIMFLVQLAFIVAFGVLLDTVLVRSLLVPALAYDIGSRIWWPGKLARESSAPSAGTREEEEAPVGR